MRSGTSSSSAAINDFLMGSPNIANPPGNHPSITHVETKIAWAMRNHGITDADVVINNDTGPCDEPYGCTAAVSAILPEGSSLTVWYPDSSGGLASPAVIIRGVGQIPQG